MTIDIYKGAGASPNNAKILHQAFGEALHPFGKKIRYLTHDDLNDPRRKWQEDSEALIIGGGAFTPMKNAVTTQGFAAIKEFTDHKTCVGICMGGYGLSHMIEFLGEDGSKKSPGIGIFNGLARGSVPITPTPYNGNNNSATIASFYHEKRDIAFPALYWGGPEFITTTFPDNAGPTITMDVPYSEKPLTMGVTVEGRNSGKSLLLGYHSEAAKTDYLRRWLMTFSASEADNIRLETEMAKHKPWQFYLGFAALLDDMGIIKDHSFVNQIVNPHLHNPATSRLHAPQPQPAAL